MLNDQLAIDAYYVILSTGGSNYLKDHYCDEQFVFVPNTFIFFSSFL